MARLGCLLGLLVIALLCVELWVLLCVLGWTKTLFGLPQPEVLGTLLAVAATSALGVWVCRYHLRLLPLEVMSGRLGHRAVGFLGGLLLVVPGFVTDVIGLLLQIPLVQGLFARWAQLVAMALLRHGMKRMGGQMPGGFPGGFPFPGGGFPGGAFPGGPFPRPDDRVRPPPKVIDAEVEKDDPPAR